jgi:hypothetical protein
MKSRMFILIAPRFRSPLKGECDMIHQNQLRGMISLNQKYYAKPISKRNDTIG